MKRSRFSESQIVEILKEADAGLPANEVWRKHGISSATYYIYGRLPRGKKVRVLF
jgi:putative transposase